MKLVPIPEDKYDEYRLNVMFDGYKWDPQFLDHNTVAKHAIQSIFIVFIFWDRNQFHDFSS